MQNSDTGHQIIIIGIGNASRQDDGVGPFVIEQLEQKDLGGEVELVKEFGDGFSLMEMWKGREVSILVDSVCSGVLPGTIHRIDVRKEQIPKESKPYSTHAFSLPEIIELARGLGQIPEQFIFYGIEGRQFGAGYGLSLEVRKSVDNLVERIMIFCRGGPCACLPAGRSARNEGGGKPLPYNMIFENYARNVFNQ